MTTVAVASIIQPTMPPRRKAGAPKKVVGNNDPSPTTDVVPVDPAAASGGPAAVPGAIEEEESTSTASSRPLTPQVPDLPMPDVPVPVAAPAGGTAEAAGEAPALEGLPPPAPRSKRVKKVDLVLTEDQEQDVADWYRSKEMLYNRHMAEYKRIDIKTKVIDEKAAELGCTTQQLKTWIDSMRTAVGKLTDPAKKPSGGAAKVRTDRDSWIMENFGYLEKHIKRVDAGKRKKGGQLSESLSRVSSNRGTSDDETSEAEIIHDTADDARESSDTMTTSKGGPFKGSTKGAPPPTKKTSRRLQEQQQQDSDTSTTESVKQLLEKDTNLQVDMHSHMAPTDSASLSKKFFADMIFHEVMQMDMDSWTDYQAQALQHLMQFKQACRQKRQLQQQQQQQYFMHQQMYPSPAVSSLGSSTQMFAPPAVVHSSQQYPTASVGSSSQMSSAPHQPPHQAPPGGIISQAWSMVAGPAHGRPSMSPVDCSTPQDSSMTSFLNSSLFAADDQNASFSMPTPPTTAKD